jgi:hypothetical protein
MQFMKNSLKLVGAVPFGFDLAGNEIKPNPDEMKTALRLIAMKGEGASYQKIAGQLNADAVRSKNGGKWHPKTVMGVVRYFRSFPGDPRVMTFSSTSYILLKISLISSTYSEKSCILL